MRKHILLPLFLVFLLGTAYAQGPVITGLLPQNNATSVSVQPQLQISFDVNVQKGEGEVVIKQWGSDAIVEAIDVNSEQVAIANATVTISPAIALSTASAYYATIEQGAFENLAAEPFLGFADNTTWSFTTACGPGPTNLGGGTTNNTATLDWDVVEGAVDYQLWIEGEGIIASTGGNNYYVINNLPSGYTFNWTVKYQCPNTEYIVYSDSSFSQFRTKGTNACANAPTGLAAEVTKESATLTWSAVAGVVYEVSVEGLGIVADSVVGNYYDLTGLSPLTSYSFTVRAVCAEYLKSEWSEEVSFTTESCAMVPTGLSVSDITDNSIMLNWDDMGTEDYQLWISGVGIIYSTNGQNSYLLDSLGAGSTYSWSVKSRCREDGRTVFSSRVSGEFTTSGENICAQAPQNLIVVNIEPNAVTLNWDDMGASDYQLWVSGIGVISSTNGQNNYLLEGLAAGATYTWMVKSKCQWTGRTVFSDNASGEFTTSGENICAQAPQNLIVGNIEPNAVTLNWEDMGASDYQLWVSGIGTISSTNGQNNYLLEGLAAGATYTWMVKSKCQWTGRTVFSDNASGEFTTSGENICAQTPQNLIVSDIEPNAVTLNWEDMGASDYQLWVSGIGVISSTNGQNNYLLEGLAAGATYTWMVKSKCQWTGRAIFSGNALDEFTTSGESICAEVPQNLIVSNIEPNAVTLNWEDMGASDYQLWVSGIGTISSTNGQNSHLLEGLTPGATYNWNVKSKCQWTGRAVFSGLAYGATFSTPETINIEENDQPVINPEKQVGERAVAVQGEALKISLYPNPIVDEVNLVVTGDDVITSWAVLNLNGDILKQNDNLNSTFETIYLRGFSAGIYVIKISIKGNQVVTKRVVIK